MAMKLMFLSLPLSVFAGVVATIMDELAEMRMSDLPNNMPRMFESERYGRWSIQKEVPMDGKCQMLKPTDALNSDSNCQDMMVIFDRSHYRMFDRPHEESTMTSYIGGMVESVKCEMVDASTEVSNSNGHASSMHMSQCVGDKCNSNHECHFNVGGHLFCSEKMGMTCQKARFTDIGKKCTEDHECREGYCSEIDGDMKCMPKRVLNALCSSSAECMAGTMCCEISGEARCSRDICSGQGNQDVNICFNIGRDCTAQDMCCSANCMFDPMLMIGQCM
ncbi:hypothetical protein N7520_004848 [Penicillium odoratum]|uniref:uncharacterized protein n=1 Tax=Penicillium odoratum TaxID=1167516 RepID=UPI00254849A8|nr:uncharacterized protein N7520_004848 [Penicillium odoratum]KAJ5765289.1 hypothetical protein N7520_004848 [Penicillium odoratum]